MATAAWAIVGGEAVGAGRSVLRVRVVHSPWPRCLAGLNGACGERCLIVSVRWRPCRRSECSRVETSVESWCRKRSDWAGVSKRTPQLLEGGRECVLVSGG